MKWIKKITIAFLVLLLVNLISILVISYNLKKILIQIIDYLYQIGIKKDRIIGIINPLKTQEQAQQLMKWIQKNSKVTPDQMRKQAKMISQI